MISPAYPSRGACYGFEIRSELEFRYLRQPGQRETLEISPTTETTGAEGELLRSWDPPAFPYRVRLYRGDDGTFRLWNEDAGWFLIDPSRRRISVPADSNPVRREERIWGLPAMLCFQERGDLGLHGSCVEIDGQALVMAAPKRFGKTTLAASFAAAGYRVLAEDLVCIRPGPAPVVFPGPAMLRVRRDIADMLTLSNVTELGRDEDRAHLALEDAGNGDPVPLAGIVILQEGDTDPVIERGNPADLVRDLWYLTLKLHSDDDMQRCFSQVGQLAFGTSSWVLTRRLRVPDLRPTIEVLVDLVRRQRIENGVGR